MQSTSGKKINADPQEELEKAAIKVAARSARRSSPMLVRGILESFSSSKRSLLDISAGVAGEMVDITREEAIAEARDQVMEVVGPIVNHGMQVVDDLERLQTGIRRIWSPINVTLHTISYSPVVGAVSYFLNLGLSTTETLATAFAIALSEELPKLV